MDGDVGAFLFTPPSLSFFQEMFPPYGRSSHLQNHRKSHLDIQSTAVSRNDQSYRKKAVEVGLHLQVQRHSVILASSKEWLKLGQNLQLQNGNSQNIWTMRLKNTQLLYLPLPI